MSDPDFYFAKRKVEIADTIRDLEESLREAEERGDTEMAETWRNHLSIVREVTENDDYYANLVTSIIKGTTEEFFLKDRPQRNSTTPTPCPHPNPSPPCTLDAAK